MPKEEKITRKEGVRAEVAPSRSVKKLFSLAHEKATRAIVSVSLAAALASCSPAVSQAQDTTPAKGKPVAAAVEKKGVTYETIADMNELAPYLDNAKDKLVSIKSGETKQFGPYKVNIDTDFSNDSGTQYEITTDDGKYFTVTMLALPQNINVLLLDIGDNHPYIKGKTLVFANNEQVWFMYFNKQKNQYEEAVVRLEEGKMRAGPVQLGYGMDKGGLFVITAPKSIIAGDVIAQAIYANDGCTAHGYFVYDPKKPAGTQVASVAINY